MTKILNILLLAFLVTCLNAQTQDIDFCEPNPCGAEELCVSEAKTYICIPENSIEKALRKELGRANIFVGTNDIQPPTVLAFEDQIVPKMPIKQQRMQKIDLINTNQQLVNDRQQQQQIDKTNEDLKILNTLLGDSIPALRQPEVIQQALTPITTPMLPQIPTEKIPVNPKQPIATGRIVLPNTIESTTSVAPVTNIVPIKIEKSNEIKSNSINKIPPVQSVNIQPKTKFIERPTVQRIDTVNTNSINFVPSTVVPTVPKQPVISNSARTLPTVEPVKPVKSNDLTDEDLAILQGLNIPMAAPISPASTPRTKATNKVVVNFEPKVFQPTIKPIDMNKQPSVVSSVQTDFQGNNRINRIKQVARKEQELPREIQIPVSQQTPSVSSVLREKLRLKSKARAEFNPIKVDTIVKEVVEKYDLPDLTITAPLTPTTRKEQYCLGYQNGDQIPHPTDSRKFIMCQFNDYMIMSCPASLVFNRYLNRCDRTENEPPKACLSSPCKNDGKCVDTDSYTFECQCQEGFSGLTCEKGVDPCASNPCSPRGVCNSLEVYKFLSIKYYCLCDGGNSYGLSCDSNSFPNPCNRYHSEAYFSSKLSNSLFIHCESNIMNIKTCHQPLVWSQKLLTCISADELSNSSDQDDDTEDTDDSHYDLN